MNYLDIIPTDEFCLTTCPTSLVTLFSIIIALILYFRSINRYQFTSFEQAYHYYSNAIQKTYYKGLIILGIILITPIPAAFTGVTVLILSNIVPWQEFWLSVGYWLTGSYFTNSLVVTLALVLLSPKLEKKKIIIPGLIS